MVSLSNLVLFPLCQKAFKFRKEMPSLKLRVRIFASKLHKIWILVVLIFPFFVGWSNFDSYKRNIGGSV